MTLVKLLGADLRDGLRGLWPVAILAIALFWSTDLLLWSKCETFAELGKNASAPSLGDCFAALFAGSLDLRTLDMGRMSPPVTWIAVMGLFLYAPLSYPYSNLMGFGKQLLVVGKSRWAWWLSKCAWVVLCTLLFVVVALFAAVSVSVAAGGELSWTVQEGLPGLLALNSRAFSQTGSSILPFAVQVIVSLCAFSLVQLALSLVFRPVPSYVAGMAIMTLSAFYSGPPFVGELCMWARSLVASPMGIDPVGGISTSLVLAALAIAIGGMRFSKMDIMDKELNA